MKKRLGFSLIELLVVLALITVLASISAPFIGRHIAQIRVDDRAEQLAALFHSARQEALFRNTPIVICPVLIRTDLRSSGHCHFSHQASGWRSFADEDHNGRYNESKPDLPIRTAMINPPFKNQVLLEIKNHENSHFSGSFFVFTPQGQFRLIQSKDGSLSPTAPHLHIILKDAHYPDIQHHIIIQHEGVILSCLDYQPEKEICKK